METSLQASTIPFDEAILKSKVAQICDLVGYNAITQDSYNILVDLYRRSFEQFARHCKDAANINRRVEPTLVDLMQALDFLRVSIPDLQEYIETVKLPSLKYDLVPDADCKPSKGIQRNLLVDDLLEAEKSSHLEDQEDGENKALSENGAEEDEKPSVPLLRDTYEEIANKFSNCTPVSADKKIRGGRIVLVASTKLKISTPAPAEPVPSTSNSDSKSTKKKKKREVEKKKSAEVIAQPISPVKQGRGRGKGKGKGKGKKKKKLSREFVPPDHSPDKEDKVENIDKSVIEQSNEEKGIIKVVEKKRGRGRARKDKEGSTRKSKTPATPVEIPATEPPLFFPPEKDEAEQSTTVVAQISPKLPKETKGKRKKRSSDENLAVSKSVSPVEAKEVTKAKTPGRKKLKTAITPLDPSIAEPPSFFPILENRIEDPVIEETQPQPTPPPGKQPKGKKKKKSTNQFAIVTETVTAAEEKEWLCPHCGGPDDGDLMVQCDSCQEWYHLLCTSLTKPPEDDENWECEPCANKTKKTPKKPPTPVVEATKVKTPEPVVRTPTPASMQLPAQIQHQQQQLPSPVPPPTVPPGTSQDDLCPECNLPDDGTMMIQCDDPFCARWFHGKCVNLLEEPKEDESWFCKVCVDKQKSAFTRRRRPK